MTAASRVRADYEQLAEIAQLFSQQAESTRQVLGGLEKSQAVLEGGHWLGKGAEIFYAEMNSAVLPAMRRVVAALNEAANITRKASQVMKQAEQDAAALFRLDGSGGLLPATVNPSVFSPIEDAAPIPAAFAGRPPASGAGSTSTGTSPAASAVRQKAGQANDPRAEKIQPLLDEANHLKEMYEDTKREKWERKKKYAEAIRLKKSEREILRLKADVVAMEHAEKFYEEDMTQKYDEAIDLAVKLYKIDVTAVKGKPEYWDGTGNSGFTDWDRSVTIGPGGVGLSAGWLASTIGHETVHAKQMKEGRAYDEDENPQGHAMNEIECYHWELANAQRNGLTQDEIDKIRKMCREYYDNLEQKNQERVNRGIYKPI